MTGVKFSQKKYQRKSRKPNTGSMAAVVITSKAIREKARTNNTKPPTIRVIPHLLLTLSPSMIPKIARNTPAIIHERKPTATPPDCNSKNWISLSQGIYLSPKLLPKSRNQRLSIENHPPLKRKIICF